MEKHNDEPKFECDRCGEARPFSDIGRVIKGRAFPDTICKSCVESKKSTKR